jgi:GT2 family glycosyltransferase
MDPNDEAAPLVHVVVLNWNGWRDTVHCVALLRGLTYPRYRVLVVDNGSSDGSESEITKAHPDIPLIQTGSNLGFGAGNNIAMQRALSEGAQYVWVLNNDTQPFPESLTSLIRVMEAVPRVGILSPVVSNSGTGEPEPLNRFPPGLRRPTSSPESNQSGFGALGLELLDTAPGCSMLLRRALIEELGGFDERYFHFFEDTDLCWRAWKSNWLVGRTRSCRIDHHYGTSTEHSRPLLLYYMLRNMLLFASRATGESVGWLLVRHPLLWVWALGPLFGLRSFRRPAVKLAVLRAVADALRGRRGRCATYSPS